MISDDEWQAKLARRLSRALFVSLVLHLGILAIVAWIRLPRHGERPLASVEISLASLPVPQVKTLEPQKSQPVSKEKDVERPKPTPQNKSVDSPKPIERTTTIAPPKAVPVPKALDILHDEAKQGKLDVDLLQVFTEAKVYELTARRAAGTQ